MVLSFLVYGNIAAQTSTYSEKDADGNKLYYKIMSAATGYENKCIEDNIRNAGSNNYNYILNDTVSDNNFQQWQIVPNTIGREFYYVKNRRSMRYMKNEGVWAGTFIALEGGGTNKYSTKPFEFYAIGNNQVVIRYTDTDGSTHYLNAIDSGTVQINKIVLSRAQNTTYAWKVVNLDGTPATGIKSITGDNAGRIGIAVINRSIVVNGTDNYQIHDLQGRPVAKEAVLPAGTYIVNAEGRGYKVLVK